MPKQPATGFTLLEILVVLAVFGFLLAGLSQTVRFGLTAWRQQGRLSAPSADMEAVDRTLRTLLTNLAPGEPRVRPAILGSADRLSGVTELPLPGTGPTPAQIEAGLAVSGNRLVLRWRPYHRGVPLGSPPEPQETALLDGVASLAIAYWQPTGVWTSRWTGQDLPRLIRIRLRFAGAEHWPDIVVAPVLSRR